MTQTGNGLKTANVDNERIKNVVALIGAQDLKEVLKRNRDENAGRETGDEMGDIWLTGDINISKNESSPSQQKPPEVDNRSKDELGEETSGIIVTNRPQVTNVKSPPRRPSVTTSSVARGAGSGEGSSRNRNATVNINNPPSQNTNTNSGSTNTTEKKTNGWLKTAAVVGASVLGTTGALGVGYLAGDRGATVIEQGEGEGKDGKDGKSGGLKDFDIGLETR